MTASPSSARGDAGAARRGSLPVRVINVWRSLAPERRLAASAALGLFLTLFLDWYQETVILGGTRGLRSASVSLTGWEAFSFVEAAVLLVAVSVLVLIFMRAEGHAFHLPGGDGGAITGAGLWTCLLIVWRMFDKQGTTRHAQFATTSGIDWGIFVALGVAVLLTYSGSRIRHARDPEPPLPGESVTVTDRRPEPREPSRPRARPAADAERPPRRRGPTAALARREIQELEIAEPPPSRLARSKPAPWPGVRERHDAARDDLGDQAPEGRN